MCFQTSTIIWHFFLKLKIWVACLNFKLWEGSIAIETLIWYEAIQSMSWTMCNSQCQILVCNWRFELLLCISTFEKTALQLKPYFSLVQFKVWIEQYATHKIRLFFVIEDLGCFFEIQILRRQHYNWYFGLLWNTSKYELDSMQLTISSSFL